VLPEITAPTLVVHGTDDVFNPAANAALLANRIPGARLHLISGERHAYFEEFRSEASPLVIEFLREYPAGRFQRNGRYDERWRVTRMPDPCHGVCCWLTGRTSGGGLPCSAGVSNSDPAIRGGVGIRPTTNFGWFLQPLRKGNP
jgi:hypothetical protein